VKTVTDIPLLAMIGRRRAPALCISVLLLALAGAAAPLRAEIIDRVLAVVGTTVVTLSDVRAAETFGLTPGTSPSGTPVDVLAYLIDRELMLGEVDRYVAPEPGSAALDRRGAQVRARFPTQELYEQALAGTAMTGARLRSVIAENIRIETYVEQRFGTAAQPTPDEVLRYYRENPADFTRAGQLAPFDEVQAAVQQKLAADRRRTLVADWLDRLRRRGQVRIVGQVAPVSEAK
jgi:hypothetical protein